MGLKFIIFSLLLTATAAASNWMELTDDLVSENPVQIATARKQLLSLPTLDAELRKAIETGSGEREALTLIRKLPKLELVEAVLAKAKDVPLDEDRAVHYYGTLLSLTTTTKGEQILEEVSRRIKLEDQKISPTLRIALLTGMAAKDRIPSPKTSLNLLDDPSYEVRTKIMEVLSEDLEKNPTSYKDFLRKALLVSPYTVRLRAVQAIADSGDLRKEFADLIKTCAQKDENPEVRQACQSVKP